MQNCSQFWKAIFLLALLMHGLQSAEASASRKKILTFSDFEKSYLYKELNFSRIKTLPKYRIYKDLNNNYIVALQINKKGFICAERIMPIPRVPSKAQNGGVAMFVIDFIFGNKAVFEDMSASKEVSTHVQQFSEGTNIKGFTVQLVQDPWKKRAGLEVRTPKAAPWNIAFAEPVAPQYNEENQFEKTSEITSYSPSKAVAVITPSAKQKNSYSPKPAEVQSAYHNDTDIPSSEYTAPEPAPAPVDYNSNEYYCKHVGERVRVKWLPYSGTESGSFSIHCRIAADGAISPAQPAANSQEDRAFQVISNVELRKPPTGGLRVLVTFNGDRVSVNPE